MQTIELSKEQRSALRATIFQHLDGFAVASSAFALKKGHIFELLKHKKTVSLEEVCWATEGNMGYLNVALRLLCSQAWLSQESIDGGKKISFTLTPKGLLAIDLVDIYMDVVHFMPIAIEMNEALKSGFSPENFEVFRSLMQNHRNDWGLEKSTDAKKQALQEEMLRHIEGILTGTIVVALGMNGFFKQFNEHKTSFEISNLEGNQVQLLEIFDFLSALGWFIHDGNKFTFTPKGIFWAKRVSAYGVTVSYLPTFSMVSELLYGNPRKFWDRPDGSPEIHVNRRMNVWGSGGAHNTYFRKIDEVIIDLFNRPIEEQPKGFADMGSGNGAFLAHLFEVIYTKTKRGKMLQEHPLFIVGSDFNDAALTATRETLTDADVWAKVIWGDIGDPYALAKELKIKHDIDLGDLLNVRSFLDHNRIYVEPENIDQTRISNSTGAFAFRGRRIPNNEIEQNLVDHFKAWAPYVKRFGLLVIELHTISPSLAGENIGKTAVTAYDGTHGYSDQYIVELDIFLKAAREAGLYPDKNHQTQYPPSDLATVSVNLLRAE